MKLSLTVLIVGLITLLFSQIFWLNRMYTKYVQENQTKYNQVILLAIDKELGLRFGGEPENPINPKFTIKSEKDMTPEERNSLKGDSLNLDEINQMNIGQSFSNIFTQSIQDLLMKKEPLLMHSLDSIFKSIISKEQVTPSYLIKSYNAEKQVTASSGNLKGNTTYCVLTEMKPIGTKGLQFIQATIKIPPQYILKQMFYSLIISALVVLLVAGCLFYMLTIIRRKDQILKQREQALNGTIHDLKSPLAGIFTMLSFFFSNETDIEKQTLLQEAQIRIKRLSETIETLLTTAKADKQKIILNYQPINLLQLIETIKKDMTVLFPDKQYSITVNTTLNNPVIVADPIYMENCLKNLIENALKYSNNHAIVNVLLSDKNKMLSITIKDNGWGIPAKAKKKIFTQFYQVPRPKMMQGYGVGLSFVQRIVKEHGGKITFSSIEEVGSTFFITLPPYKV